MARKYRIDTSIKTCSQCKRPFRIMDYPPGYFTYKYQVREGTLINTCPSCETKMLMRTIENTDNPQFKSRLEDDVRLLETGRTVNEDQRKRAIRTHGQ